MEQQRLLRYVGDLAAQRLLRRLGDVLAVDEDAPLLDVGQAQQKLRERGLPRPARAHEAHALACGDMQLEVVEHVRARVAVGVPEVDALEVDGALAHLELRRAGLVVHEARLVKDDGHAARVAERAVEALQPIVDEVELIRHRVGVGEHHHERAGRDAVPRVAARDEHRHHAHDGDGDARRHDAARQRSPHALRVARHHLAVRLVEQPPLVVLAPVGLHRQDVRHRVGQLARQLVLRAGRLLVEVQDALVHVVRHARVHRQQHHEDGHVHRHPRREDGAGEHHRADDRQKRERDGFQQQLVGAHELRRLADQRAAEAV